MTRWLVCCCLLVVVAVSGCTTKSKSKAQAQAAFLAGRQQAMATQSQGPSVQVVGDVKNHVVPWTDDLTLAKALVAAEYQGLGDPSRITVVRKGEPMTIDPKTLLGGKDLPLEAGDRVEISP